MATPVAAVVTSEPLYFTPMMIVHLSRLMMVMLVVVLAIVVIVVVGIHNVNRYMTIIFIRPNTTTGLSILRLFVPSFIDTC
ncbi:hypothetical protein HanRHA438_Chr02g0089461 [Helianthus annuus]|nr:hypothetical protein HanRHA438_Chr02g0089461 [Helianthus annuus]